MPQSRSLCQRCPVTQRESQWSHWLLITWLSFLFSRRAMNGEWLGGIGVFWAGGFLGSLQARGSWKSCHQFLILVIGVQSSTEVDLQQKVRVRAGGDSLFWVKRWSSQVYLCLKGTFPVKFSDYLQFEAMIFIMPSEVA